MRACGNPDVSHPSWPHARSQWWVGYLLGANANYLTKGPGFLDPRWGGPLPASPRACSSPCQQQPVFLGVLGIRNPLKSCCLINEPASMRYRATGGLS